jgi:hypothetical protein
MRTTARALPGQLPEEVITMTSPPARQPQASGEQITVALIPAVTGHLRRLQQRTKLSRSDLANRAITSYEFFDAQLRDGNDLLIRNNRTGVSQLVQLK